MFGIGDTVLYGSDGVCKISEITEKVFGDSKALYYILTPVFNNRSTVFVPMSNEKLVSRMQYVLSIDEIKGIIADTDSDMLWIDSDTERTEHFKQIISSGDFSGILHMAKCIGLHKAELLGKGKKLHKFDENILKDAIKIVYEEMALSIDISKENVEDIICRKLSFA